MTLITLITLVTLGTLQGPGHPDHPGHTGYLGHPSHPGHLGPLVTPSSQPISSTGPSVSPFRDFFSKSMQISIWIPDLHLLPLQVAIR